MTADCLAPARAMAHELQKGTSSEAVQTSNETGRLPYSRASFERVPMEEPIPRGPGRPRKNAPKIRRVSHQAYCGTATLHDPRGEALYTIRFGQMPDGNAESLSSVMANAVYRLRKKNPGLMLELLADGAHEMWDSAMTKLMAAQPTAVKLAA